MKKALTVLALLCLTSFQAQAEMPIIEIMGPDFKTPITPIYSEGSVPIIKFNDHGQVYLRATNRVEALKKDEDNICIHVSDKNFFQGPVG